jgi:type VI secretion system protein ImpG
VARGAAKPTAPSPLLPLRLHLAGERRSALLLLSWIHQHLASVEVESDGRTHSLGRGAVRLWGYGRDEALLPVEPLEHPGFRLLRELMVLWAKFAFFEVRAEEAIVPTHGKATLRLHFDTAAPPSIHMEGEPIRTNCVPVSNVFFTTSDPVEPSLERPEQIIRPATVGPEQGEVYMVRAVRARLANGRTYAVAPAAGFGEGAYDALPGVLYATYSTASRHVQGSDVTIALTTPPDATVAPDVHVLSLDLWATQRAIPTALGVGAVNHPSPLSPRDVTFRNIRAVTPYRPAPDGELLAYHALAMVGLSFRPLADRASLQALLSALDLHGQHDAQAARALVQRIEAIAAVRSTPTTERIGGVSIHGSNVEIELVEGTFDGDGEAFLFARVLAQLFAFEASLNTFARTTARLAATGRVYRFPALHGERAFV